MAIAFEILVFGGISIAIEHLVLFIYDPLEGIAEEVVGIFEVDGLDKGRALHVRIDSFNEENVLESVVRFFMALTYVEKGQGVLPVEFLNAE